MLWKKRRDDQMSELIPLFPIGGGGCYTHHRTFQPVLRYYVKVSNETFQNTAGPCAGSTVTVKTASRSPWKRRADSQPVTR